MSAISKKSQLHSIRFGTDGWRALIAKEFTYANLHLFLQGLADYILENYSSDKAIVIGYDARFLADKFAAYSTAVLNARGIRAFTISSPVPTPVIALAARDLDSCGALMFTASHNPPEYMGIKYIPEYAGPSSLEITNKILSKIEKYAVIDFEEEKTYTITQATEYDPKPAYYKQVRSLVDFASIQKSNLKHQTKLIYDPLFACGRGYTDYLLREAGFDLEVLHDNYDSSFGGSLPDPSETRLAELRQRLLETGADLGAANDGDADRFAFFDEKGNFYPANKSLPIICKYLIEYRGYRGAIARTLATTHLFDLIASKNSLPCYETEVGFKWLCEIMRREPVIIAAEESGGMSVLGHIPEKDGVLAILLMAEVLAVTGKKLSVLWTEVQDYVGREFHFSKLDLHLDGEIKEKFINEFVDIQSFAGLKVIKKDTREGIKIYLENDLWFLVRPSGTEAMCRVYLEAKSESDLLNVKQAIEALLAG